MRTAQLLSFASLIVAVSAANTRWAAAQVPPYDPYAPPVVEGSTGEDSPAQWPLFYKPPKIDARHELYYAMGWCRMKPNSYRYTAADIIDVNKLQIASFSGTVVNAASDCMMLTTAENRRLAVIIDHDSALSKVRVRGRPGMRWVRTGMYARFATAVDARGRGSRPLEKLEVFTPAPGEDRGQVEPNVVQTIAGRITGIYARHLAVALNAGPIRRVSVRLVESPEIAVDATDSTLAASGDQASVSGRLYKPQDPQNPTMLFASNLDVTLAATLDSARQSRSAKPALAVKHASDDAIKPQVLQDPVVDEE